MHSATLTLPPSIDQAAADAIAELTKLLQHGRPVDLEAFIAQHPTCSDRLRELVPTMQILLDLGYSAACATRRGECAIASDDESGRDTRTLGDFRILREIGRGGMGVVYEAEQISLGRRVALKVLPFASMLDERQLQRFKNEARAAATLDHPNIVEVHAVGCERGVHFYAMRYVEGQTLAAVIDALRLAVAGTATLECDDSSSLSFSNGARSSTDATVIENQSCDKSQHSKDTLAAALSTLRETKPRDYYRRIAELGIQAAEALDHAHQLGIVHRDIKPANLLIECSHLALRDAASLSHHAKRDVYAGLNPEP